jgi:hypothetical protein
MLLEHESADMARVLLSHPGRREAARVLASRLAICRVLDDRGQLWHRGPIAYALQVALHPLPFWWGAAWCAIASECGRRGMESDEVFRILVNYQARPLD